MSQIYKNNAGGSGPTSSDLSISFYIVDQNSNANKPPYYATIQSAIDAAQAAGFPACVYIRPGTYTEDLTLYDGIDLYGADAVSQNQGASVTLIGTHTPPNSGHVGFNSIYFQDTSAIFSSAAAGSTHLVFLNCESAVQSGYFFDLPNWTGILEVYDHNPNASGAPFAVDDGGVNNITGSASIVMFSVGFGYNGSRPWYSNGELFIESSEIGTSMILGSGSQLIIQWVAFDNTVTMNGNTSGSIYFSSFLTKVNTAIVMNSNANVTLSHNVIDTSSSSAIDGSGSGNLLLQDNSFLTSYQIGPSVITPHLTHNYSGTGQTVDVGTADLASYELRDVAAIYQFTCEVSGIAAVGGGFGSELKGAIRTDGTTASIVDTIDQIVNKNLAIAGASVALIPSGNSIILRATGSLGAVINWAADLKFKLVTN